MLFRSTRPALARPKLLSQRLFSPSPAAPSAEQVDKDGLTFPGEPILKDGEGEVMNSPVSRPAEGGRRPAAGRGQGDASISRSSLRPPTRPSNLASSSSPGQFDDAAPRGSSRRDALAAFDSLSSADDLVFVGISKDGKPQHDYLAAARASRERNERSARGGALRGVGRGGFGASSRGRGGAAGRGGARRPPRTPRPTTSVGPSFAAAGKAHPTLAPPTLPPLTSLYTSTSTLFSPPSTSAPVEAFPPPTALQARTAYVTEKLSATANLRAITHREPHAFLPPALAGPAYPAILARNRDLSLLQGKAFLGKTGTPLPSWARTRDGLRGHGKDQTPKGEKELTTLLANWRKEREHLPSEFSSRDKKVTEGQYAEMRREEEEGAYARLESLPAPAGKGKKAAAKEDARDRARRELAMGLASQRFEEADLVSRGEAAKLVDTFLNMGVTRPASAPRAE